MDREFSTDCATPASQFCVAEWKIKATGTTQSAEIDDDINSNMDKIIDNAQAECLRTFEAKIFSPGIK